MAHRLLLALAFLAACNGDPVGDAGPAEAPELLRHDFGMVPHGKAIHHDFVIDAHGLGEDLIPLGVRVDCSCARYEMILRDTAGDERLATGQPLPEFAARPDERLVVRIHLLTERKEAVDQPPASAHGHVILQPAGATSPNQRVVLPFEIRFAIDSPVRIRPFAHLDFGEVPMSRPFSLELALEADNPERAMRFGPARCENEQLEVSIHDGEGQGGETVLRVRLTPRQEGPFKTDVFVDTDLPDGYRVRIPASGAVVPDIRVKPMDKVSLGLFDFAEERDSFVLVTDHDRSRSPEFSVARLVDLSGADASQHFEVQLQPVDGDPRTTRVVVRYLGTLDPEVLGSSTFRGQLVLAKDPLQGPFVPIEVVAFHRPK